MSILGQYKAAMTRSDIVGGPYNRPEALVQRGFHPSVEPVFFDDGTFVISGSDTPQYNASIWIGPVTSAGDATGAGVVSNLETRELYLKFSRPIIAIAYLNLVVDSIRFLLSDISTTENEARPFGALAVNLVKFPLDVGQPFGLDALTGNNAAWVGNTQTHGTQYDTASNYEQFGGVGAAIWELNGTGDFDLASGYSGVGDINAAPVIFGPETNGGAVKNDGPYFGVHIFWRSFGSGDELITFFSGSANWVYSFDMPTPRGGPGDTTRGFAFDTGLFSL